MRLVAQNFARVSTAPATNIGVTPLIAMVDCEQEDAAHKYVVASKHVGPDYSTTVYDVRAGRLYRGTACVRHAGSLERHCPPPCPRAAARKA